MRDGDGVLNLVLAEVADHLVPYPACPIDITQDLVDVVVEVPSIGSAHSILSGSMSITTAPIALQIARTAADVIDASGLLKNGFSFQTGAGGISLAVASYIAQRMREQNIRGSYAAGGISAKLVVNQLDSAILGAAEIDLDFNVNVTTGPGGVIVGGSGGHSDTAAGAKLAIVTTRLSGQRLSSGRVEITAAGVALGRMPKRCGRHSNPHVRNSTSPD